MTEGNPQLEDGHLRLANELVEAFAKRNITGQEWRILWTIWRKTWCWKEGNKRKNFDWISITQFEEATGMKRVNIHRSIKSLLAKRLIVVSQKTNGELYYGFNKHYNEWLLAKRLLLVKRLRTVSQKTNKTVSQKTKHKEQTTTIQKIDSTPLSIEVTEEQLIELQKTFVGDLKTESLKFLNYWNELTPNGKKRKWQIEKTFEVKRRLITWFDRSNCVDRIGVEYYKKQVKELGIDKFALKFGVELAKKYNKYRNE